MASCGLSYRGTTCTVLLLPSSFYAHCRSSRARLTTRIRTAINESRLLTSSCSVSVFGDVGQGSYVLKRVLNGASFVHRFNLTLYTYVGGVT